MVLLLLVSSGCGSDTGASSEVTQGDDASVTGLSGDEQTAVAGLVDASQKSEEESAISSAAAPCLATGFVDRLGIGWLQDHGMLRDDLSGRRTDPTGVLSQRDAHTFFDVVLSCVSYQSVVASMVGGDDASMTDSYVTRCVEAVTEDEAHEAFAAAASDQDFHSTPFARKLEKAGCGYEGD